MSNAVKIDKAIQDKVIYVSKQGISLQQLLVLKQHGFVVIFK